MVRPDGLCLKILQIEKVRIMVVGLLVVGKLFGLACALLAWWTGLSWLWIVAGYIFGGVLGVLGGAVLVVLFGQWDEDHQSDAQTDERIGKIAFLTRIIAGVS